MNKLKKAIQNLRMNLGRDKYSLELLDAVGRHVNELRKSNADASEALADAEDSLRSCRAELRGSLSESMEIQKQNEKLRGTLDSANLHAKALLKEKQILEQKIDSLTDCGSEECELGGAKAARVSPLLRSRSRFSSLFKSLLLDMPACPKLSLRTEIGWVGGVTIFELDSIVGSYSNEDLCKLGKFAIVHSLTLGACCFTSEKTWRDMPPKGMESFSDGFLAKHIRWYEKHNMDMRTQLEVLRGVQIKGGEPTPTLSQHIKWNK